MSEIPKDNNPTELKAISVIPKEDECEAETQSFALEGKLSRKLKLALDSLSDPAFNRLGRFDANEDGLEITVKGDHECIGHVLLYPDAESISYRFYKPVKGKMIALDQVFQYSDAPDDVRFIISHDHVCNELSFAFGHGSPMQQLKVKLEDYYGVPKFPRPISFLLEIKDMPSSELKGITPNELVSVLKTDLFIVVQADKGLVWDCYLESEDVEMPGQKVYAEFHLPCAVCRILEKAAAELVLCLLNEPPNNVLFKFPLSDLSSMEIIKTVQQLLPNVENSAQELMVYKW